MLLTFLYPLIYEIVEVFRRGIKDYLMEPSNAITVVFIFFGLSNCWLQYFDNAFRIEAKVLMAIVILVSIFRTLELFRIFPLYSPTTTMVFRVISKMRYFVFALLVFVFMNSMFISVFELDIKLFKYGQPE